MQMKAKGEEIEEKEGRIFLVSLILYLQAYLWATFSFKE